MKLRIVSGSQAGHEIEVPPEGVVVGRDPASDLVIADDDASRRHFRVVPGAAGPELEDLGSTNGTYLDGLRISGRVTMGPGQRIQVGDVVFDIDPGLGATRIAARPGVGAAIPPAVAAPPPIPPSVPAPAPAAQGGGPPRRVLVAGIAGAVVLLVVILAIAGVFSGGKDEGKTATTATASTSTTKTSTTKTSSTKTASSLTPAGSKLKIGQPATVTYKDASHPKKTSTIELTPLSIQQGKIDDFKNIKLDDQQKKSTPFYLKVEAKNVGKGDLSGTNPIRTLRGVDDRGQTQSAVLILLGTFEACPSADAPKSLKHGQSYKSCLTFLMPGGGSIKGAVWSLFDKKTGKSDINWAT